MTWIFEVFVEWVFCEPMITLRLMAPAISIRKFIFVRVLISSLDLINSLWLKLRSNKKSRWCLIRDDAIKMQVFFYFLDSSFFLVCLRKYRWLKFNTFLGRMTNKTIITLKINSWKRNQKLNCVFKSLVFFIYLINSKFEDAFG